MSTQSKEKGDVGSKESHKPETSQDIKTAVKAVAESISGQNVQVMYCPKCGRRYSPRVKICPVDNTPLKEVIE